MIKNFIKLIVLLVLFFPCLAFPQAWQDVVSKGAFGPPDIDPEKYRSLTFDVGEMSNLLSKSNKGSSTQITVPLPNGNNRLFNIWPASTVSPELMAKYPSLRFFSGEAVDNSAVRIKLDYTSQGFHALILGEGATIYVDPYNLDHLDAVISYNKKDFIANYEEKHKGEVDDRICLTHEDWSEQEKAEISISSKKYIPNGTELRTYEIAITCTGEYGAFHANRGNGTAIENVLAGMATTMNRVNGVYERDVACTMVMIPETDQLIFLDGSTDPYSNSSTLLNEIDNEINSIVGADAYDIMHGFSTGAGGVASLRSVCSSSRGGVTGRSQPINDPYDIDYVAHEIGHQYGGNHTFNGSTGSCSSNASQYAYEPGSGTTIQAYAGICSGQNIQNNSDDHFHVHSFIEMTEHTVRGTGNACAAITNTGNNPPTVDPGLTGLTIPINTPFELTAEGADQDGDQLTYCWEEYDLGPQGAPNSPSNNAPLFRSFSPTSNPTRVFPKIEDVISGNQTMGELLPSYSRDLTFKCTVRDNNSQSGGVTFEEVDFEVDAAAGPFLVTYPNTNVTVEGLTNVEVTWDVANTGGGSVNAPNVDIFLSVDGGYTYEHTLITSTPNDGAAEVTIPNTPTNQARIKVKGADHIFFDISNTNFTIEESTGPTYTMTTSVNSLEVCAPVQEEIEIELNVTNGFNESVSLSANDLPNGISAQFAQNPYTPPGSTTVSFDITGDVEEGTYVVEIEANSTSIQRTANVTLIVGKSILPSSVNDGEGCEGATVMLGVEGDGLFNWYADEQSDEVLFTGLDYETPPLSATTTYFVSGQSEGQTVNVGPETSAIGSGEHSALDRYLVFDVLQDAILKSVWVNAGSSGERTIVIVENGSTIEERTVNIPAGEGRIELNMPLKTGTGFEIGIQGGNGDLFRNNEGVSFPYSSDLVVIQTSTAQSNPGGFYYYLYDWEVSTAQGACESERVEVTATIYENPEKPEIVVNGNELSVEAIYDSYQWYVGGEAINGATSSTYIAQDTGTYEVVVANGICETESDSYYHNQVVSISELKVKNLKIYPIPANNELNVSFDENHEFNYQVVSIAGEILASGVLNQNNNVIQLNTLAKGSYLLMLSNDNASRTLLFTKQ